MVQAFQGSKCSAKRLFRHGAKTRMQILRAL